MSDLNDERTTEELDKLADNADVSRNTERPMTEKDVTPPKDAKPAKEETYEFTHGGKPVKGTRDQVLKWAQMGYARPQEIQKWNQEKQEWEKSKTSLEKQYAEYKQVDEYAKTNKDWWDHILNSWKTRQTFTPGTAPVDGAPAKTPVQIQPEVNQKLQILEQKLGETSEFIKTIQQEKAEQKKAQEDEKLDKEITGLRAKHTDLDWDTLDENGKALETRILEHAQNNGIPTFRAAMRDLLFDDLTARAAAQGKLAVARGIQTRTKMGVLGESPTSAKFMSNSNRDIRKTSYEQLEQEAKEEIRRMTSS